MTIRRTIGALRQYGVRALSADLTRLFSALCGVNQLVATVGGNQRHSSHHHAGAGLAETVGIPPTVGLRLPLKSKTTHQGDSMPTVNFIEFGGHEHRIEVPAGTSVMRAAVDNRVPGIDGDCGGECACATCHVYVDQAWLPKTGERTATEEELLGFASGTEPNSRLACQIRMTDALDGLLVRMPEGQH